MQSNEDCSDALQFLANNEQEMEVKKSNLVLLLIFQFNLIQILNIFFHPLKFSTLSFSSSETNRRHFISMRII